MEHQKEQFIYTLKLIPSLINLKNWTEEENRIVEKHFFELQKLLSDRKLILAGKTSGIDEKTFGIVILEVDSEDEALNIMYNDPCVVEGIMTAELFPYKVALIKK